MTSSFARLAMAAAGSLALLSSLPAAAGSTSTHGLRVKPLKGVSFDIGTKHAVTYYENVAGVCQVTMLVADRQDYEGDVPGPAARVRVTVPSGNTARLDTIQGKSLEIGCEKAASAMVVRPVEQVAWAPAKK